MTVADRRATLTAALNAEPWSMDLAKRLAKQCGCSLTTIRNDYRALQKAGPVALTGKLGPREEWLASVVEARKAALDAETFSAVAALLKLEGSARGVDQPPAGALEDLPDLDKHESELMSCVRTMRIRAMDSGSFVAAGKLLEQEQKYVEAERAKQKARRDAELEGVPDAEVIGKLVHIVEHLPPVQRRAVMSSLAHLSQVH
jgi:hypothetical protein